MCPVEIRAHGRLCKTFGIKEVHLIPFGFDKDNPETIQIQGVNWKIIGHTDRL